jgi:hypothetical protein
MQHAERDTKNQKHREAGICRAAQLLQWGVSSPQHHRTRIDWFQENIRLFVAWPTI